MKPFSRHAAVQTAEAGSPRSPSHGHSRQASAGPVEGYELLELLGRGAAAEVWRAVHRSSGREVAVKMLRLGSSQNGGAWRFQREIRAAAALEHENIARLYDSGLGGEEAWMAMELVEGVPLDAFCLELPLRRRIEIFLAVCAGAAHAHEQGILHRDLKPANILVRADGTPKILDFGLACFVAAAPLGPTLSLDGEALGTPMFIPPDRLAAKAAEPDARVDVYALGVLLFRLCDGGWPFDETLPAIQLLAAAREAAPRSPRRGVPQDLRCIIKKAMAASPKDRYASVEALSGDLECYLKGRRVSARAWSAGYALRCAMRRHWRTAGVGLLASAAGILAFFWNEERQRVAEAQTLVLEPSSDPAHMLRAATNHRRHAAARLAKGNLTSARRHLLTGKTLLASVHRQLSPLPKYRRHVATLHRDLAGVCLRLDRPDEAMDALGVAAESWKAACVTGDPPATLLEAVEDSLRILESGHRPPKRFANPARTLPRLEAWIAKVRAASADQPAILARCNALAARIAAQSQQPVAPELP